MKGYICIQVILETDLVVNKHYTRVSSHLERMRNMGAAMLDWPGYSDAATIAGVQSVGEFFVCDVAAFL